MSAGERLRGHSPFTLRASPRAGWRRLIRPQPARFGQLIMGGLDEEQRSDRKITELRWTPRASWVTVRRASSSPARDCPASRGARSAAVNALSGRPIAQAKTRLANRARTPGRLGGAGDVPLKRPRTTATASRRPGSYTPGGRLHECAGVMHAAASAPRRLLRNPTRTLQAARRTRPGVSHVPAW
jgi:hypothetical protein